MKITENTTGLDMNVYEKNGLRRVYINRKMSVLGMDVYFDVDEMGMFLKANRKPAGGWTCERVSDNSIRVESKASHNYFVIEL